RDRGEMADALVSGTSGEIHGGSSPLDRTLFPSWVSFRPFLDGGRPMAHFGGRMFRLKSLFKLGRRGPASPYDTVLRQIPLFHTLNQRERGLVELILHER